MNKQLLYLMRNEIGLFKIGISKNPVRRCAQIRNSSGINVELLKTWETSYEARTIEQQLHKVFKDKRQNGEWFSDITLDCVSDEIEKLIDIPHLIKTVQIKHIACNRPLCEKYLEEALLESTFTVVKTQHELDELLSKQTTILTSLLKLIDKSKAVQRVYRNKENEVCIIGGGRRHWAATFAENNLFRFSIHGYRIEQMKFESISWVFGLPDTAVLPWVSTLEAANSIAEVKKNTEIQNKIEEITNRFNRDTLSLELFNNPLWTVQPY